MESVMAKKIAISEFKSHCLEILKNLEKTKSSIVITKRNKPIATVSPFCGKKNSIFGILKGKVEITGDIISSIEEEWEVDK
jgi:prevent-host-death family protein